MIYDAYNRKITEKSGAPAGVLAHWEPSDRESSDVSRDLDPQSVDAILLAANTGDITDQCRLATELEEKNWDIAHAVQTRRLAVAAVEWTVEPGDDSEGAKSAAADFEATLRSVPWEQQDDSLLTFDQAVVFDLMGALLPGFACPEIVWGQGGRNILVFNPIEQKHFTFAETAEPRLVTSNNPSGADLPPAKFLYHRHRSRSGDGTRGGLIRPLAWLHVFMRLNLADLLRFIERYGGPFLIAKVNNEAWERDRNRMKYLIQNFGSDGGAVFTSDVETELLQAANNTGDVYFRLLDYCGVATTKVVLGQTATSGDAGGLSKGQAQENVREDLLQGDCRQIDSTLDRLGRFWTAFNYGGKTPPPHVRHLCEAPEDMKLASEVLVNLGNAGWEAEDEAEVSERFGWKLRRRAAPVPGGAAGAGDMMDAANGDAHAMTAEARRASQAGVDSIAAAALSEFLDGAGQREWFGPLQVALSAALRGEPDEGTFRARLGKLVAGIPDLFEQMASSTFEDTLSRAIFTAAAQGKAAKAEGLA